MLLSKPVIAAVSGYAVAGGLELALWCDLRVMEQSATFGVFCRRWGVPLIDGGTIRLSRLIGHSRALDLILTGRPVAADEAARHRPGHRVVEEGQARAAAEALAAQIAAFPQTCMRHDRLSSYEQWGLPLPAALQNECRHGRISLDSAMPDPAPTGSGRVRVAMATRSKPAATEETNRRADIVRAAGRLFHEKGYSATTIRDIAGAVGMRSGSPSIISGPSTTCCAPWVLEGIGAISDAVAQAANSGKSPRATFRGHAARPPGPTAGRGRARFRRHTAARNPPPRPRVQAELVALKDRYESMWQKALKDLKRAGLIADDSQVARLFLLGALNWTVQWYRPDGSRTIEQIARQLADLLIGKPQSP